jgi:[ribosomal protein S5]-alanine N-acetyltransferase
MITEESFIDFSCPYCEGAVSFPQENAGFLQACPNCSESLIVPDDGSGAGRKLPIPITTPRLVLRRLAPGDWKDLLELVTDEEVLRYLDVAALDEDGVLRWLESDAHVKLTTPEQAFHLGIEFPAEEKLIGYLSLAFSDAQRLQVTFQICLGRNFQQRGFAREAVAGLLQFCFEGIRLHRVAGWCDHRNTAACRLLAGAGLRREGEFVKSRWLHGEWANSVWFAILAEEHRASGGKASPA